MQAAGNNFPSNDPSAQSSTIKPIRLLWIAIMTWTVWKCKLAKKKKRITNNQRLESPTGQQIISLSCFISSASSSRPLFLLPWGEEHGGEEDDKRGTLSRTHSGADHTVHLTSDLKLLSSLGQIKPSLDWKWSVRRGQRWLEHTGSQLITGIAIICAIGSFHALELIGPLLCERNRKRESARGRLITQHRLQSGLARWLKVKDIPMKNVDGGKATAAVPRQIIRTTEQDPGLSKVRAGPLATSF